MSQTPPTADASPPRLRAALATVVLLAAALVVLRLDEVPVGAVTDDAYYVEMARSLAAGHGPELRLGPDGSGTDPDIFPPGFPLLLAPLARVFPDSLAVLKLVPLLATALLLVVTWSWPPPGSGRGLRLALLAVTALNPWLIGWAGRLLSDVPYAALSLGALVLAARTLARPDERRRDVVLVGILAGAAIAVRTIGWAPALAIAAVCVAERRWTALAGYGAGIVGVLGPLWLLTGTGPVSAAYGVQLSAGDAVSAWRFALGNAVGYVGQLATLLVPVFGAPLEAIFRRLHLGPLYPAVTFGAGAGLILAAAHGAASGWRQPRRRIGVRLAVFTILLTGAVLVNFHGYPTAVQTRLLLPLAPLLAWLVLAGVWARPRAARIVVVVMIGAALGHGGWRVARPLRATANPDGTGLVDPGVGADWIRARTEPDAVIMTNDPLQRHVHLRRPVVGPPPVATPDALAGAVAARQVRFILVGPSVHEGPGRLAEPERALLALLQSRPDLYRPAFTDAAAAVYAFEPSAVP